MTMYARCFAGNSLQEKRKMRKRETFRTGKRKIPESELQHREDTVRENRIDFIPQKNPCPSQPESHSPGTLSGHQQSLHCTPPGDSSHQS